MGADTISRWGQSDKLRRRWPIHRVRRRCWAGPAGIHDSGPAGCVLLLHLHVWGLSLSLSMHGDLATAW